MLPNAYYVAAMNKNLISYAKITNKNKIVSKGEISKTYNPHNELIAIRCQVLFTITIIRYVQANNLEINTLGHINLYYLDTLAKNDLIKGLLRKLGNKHFKYAIYIMNKMHNMPFENKRYRAKEILEVIHTVLNGLHATIGNLGERYFPSFIDYYSKLTKIYCINIKDIVYECFENYINEMKTLTRKKIEKL